MGITTDRHDGCLHEIDPETGMQKCYLVLPDGERKNLVRPVRRTYIHMKCGTSTTMARELAETYAANPSFYGGTYCVNCRGHFPVGANGEFVWDGTAEKVGTLMVVLRRPASRDRAWHLMDVFAAVLIVTVFAAFVAFDAALLLGAVWLLLWAAQHVVGLFA